MIKSCEALVNVMDGTNRRILNEELEELRKNETPTTYKVFMEIAVLLGHQEGVITLNKPITTIPMDDLKKLVNQLYKMKFKR